jgi:diguanylate cyclase (GGDEF)-like protein
LNERHNILEKEKKHLLELDRALKLKIKNYARLEKFTEDLNHETSLDRSSDLIVREVSELFGSRGNVLLYLINEKSRKLELRSINKENESQKFKEKTGDLFDHWVLRHNQPLLVEDVANDFRFDPDRIRQEVVRPLGSLICLPLETPTNSLGILRLDAPVPDFYHADDLRFLSVIADIVELSLENALYFSHMQELSITDGLTGIYLRRYALERLKEEFLRAEREKTPFSFLMVDIDHFKKINDSYGHMAGDVVLKKVARMLKESFHLPGGVVGRFGGEEFCVVLPYILKAEALKLAENFCRILSGREIILRREKVNVTVSIGVASFPLDAQKEEDLIRLADEALFKAKRGGRNRAC